MMKNDHPDANLLTAFAEDKLLRRERDEVLSHLAECADCRLALALAATPAQPHASMRSAPVVWRWAAALASIALIVGAGWGLRLAIRSPQNRIATQMPTPIKTEVAANTPAALPERAAESKKAIRERPSIVASKRFVAPKATAIVRPAQTSASVAQAPPVVIAPAAQAPSMADEISKSAALQAAPAPQEVYPRGESLKPLSESSARISAAPRNLFMRQGAQPAMAKKSATKSSTWRIRSSSLERSPDGGKSWELVPVSEDAAFHAVAADGMDVWAGGSRGVLFHSADGGLNWVRVKVGEEKQQLAGTVIAIRLPEPSEIILETDSTEQWISRDGGIEWQRL